MLVSIIIPTYGRSKKLKEALESVLNQSYKNIEILIIDDNNPTSEERKLTKEIIKPYLRNNIKYITHKKNFGANKARNTGIKYSTGKYIAFLDDDDEYTQTHLEESVKKIIETGADLVYVGANFINRNNLKSRYVYEEMNDLKLDILLKNYIPSNSLVLLNKKKILQIGGFDETLKSCQDWDLWIRFIYSGAKVIGINKPLVNYNIDDTIERISNNYLKRISGHEEIFKKNQKYLMEFSKEKRLLIENSQEYLLASIYYEYYIFYEYRNRIKKIFNINFKYLSKIDYLKYIFSFVRIKLKRNIIDSIKSDFKNITF